MEMPSWQGTKGINEIIYDLLKVGAKSIEKSYPEIHIMGTYM